MPDEPYKRLPGPEPDLEDEPEGEAPPRRLTPDYGKFAGQRWWQRQWVQKYGFPAGIIAFAAIMILTRTGSVMKTAFEPAPGGADATVGQLRNNVRSNIRKPVEPFRAQSVPEQQPDTDQQGLGRSGGGTDYWQQRAEEKRRHRVEAFAAPIFAQDAPTGKPASVARQEPPSVLDLLSGADLSGLSPQQTAQLKHYLQAQQLLEGGQMAGIAPQATPSTSTDGAPASPQPATAQRVAFNSQEPQKEKNVELNQATGPLHRIFAGTVVEAALDTALESSMTGVVLAHLTRDVHTHNPFGPVLLPAGTQLVGEAAAVTSLNQPRLKVTFDMAIEPNGYTINLDQFQAMNQKGETGLADSVNNHWLRTIGIAVAVGVIEGLADFSGGVNVLSSRTEIYTGVGSEAGREGIRILDRFLNVPPTVTVNPGSRIRIVFPVGLDGVPEYANTKMPGANGDLRVKQKYLSPPGRGNMLYLPPACDPALLRNVALPLILTEGEFKTLALWRLATFNAADGPRFLPVGIAGVFSWRGTIAKATGPDGQRLNVKGPIADLDWIAWKDRTVIVAFDADAGTKDQVRYARSELAQHLRRQGAVVGFYEWEFSQGKGVDDHVAVVGPDVVLSEMSHISLASFDWRNELIRSKPTPANKQGHIYSVLANAIAALRYAPEWKGVLATRIETMSTGYS